MPSLHVLTDIEEAGGLELLKGREPGDVIHLSNDAVVEIGGLRDGTASGKPSVAMAFKLPPGTGDAKVVVFQTTLDLLETAVRAIRAAQG